MKAIATQEAKNPDDFQVNEIIIKQGEILEQSSETESFYYVLSGYGIFGVETYGYSLNPEIALYIPSATSHTISNSGSVDLTLARYTV